MPLVPAYRWCAPPYALTTIDNALASDAKYDAGALVAHTDRVTSIARNRHGIAGDSRAPACPLIPANENPA